MDDDHEDNCNLFCQRQAVSVWQWNVRQRPKNISMQGISLVWKERMCRFGACLKWRLGFSHCKGICWLKDILWLCWTQQDSLLLLFDAFWNMPMISKYIRHVFPFSVGDQNNEGLFCKLGFVWEDDFQLISTGSVSTFRLTLPSCCATQQIPSNHLELRVIMEKEMERNVQRRGNQKQQWPVYVCMYLFNPGRKCLQFISLSPFSHCALRECLT